MTEAMNRCWPRVGVGAVVCKEDAILLIQRARPPQQGLWAIPGGKVEPGEGLRAAAEREILEETSVQVRAGELAWQFEHIERDEQGQLRFHYVILDFFAEYVAGEPQAGDDASQARWVGFDELGELALHPETRRLVESLFPQCFAKV